jgi:hypothetical protein
MPKSTTTTTNTNTSLNTKTKTKSSKSAAPERRAVPAWVILLVVGAPTAAVASLSGQGFQPQGFQPQGFQPQGFQPQGFQPQGFQPQGFQPQGFQPQGFQPQAGGVALLGTDLVAADLVGVEIGSVDMKGLTADSPVQPFELTDGIPMSTGRGSHIVVGGGTAVGHYAVAHLLDAAGNPAEDLDLFIADQRPDPIPNLLHIAGDQDNDDLVLYTVYYYHRWSGQWASLCPFHDATGGATAMAIPEDPGQPNKFIFACTATGVSSKCARGWGFKPWRDGETFVFNATLDQWEPQTHALKPYYDACKVAARAGYCQDRQSFTRAGTLVDLFDTRQYVWPNPIENPLNAANPASQWMFAQEYFISTEPPGPGAKPSALQRTRYRDLSPTGRCDEFARILRLEHDHFEDGKWASPLTNTPFIQVFSPNSCSHDEDTQGDGLPWDCSPCTTAVCRTIPDCCRPGAGGAWNATCTTQADAVCRDNPPVGPRWPLGKVWPRDLPRTYPAPPKFLVGPNGAVERIDGVSSGDQAVTVSGWACDPEWPGASVTVKVFDAPAEQPGAVALGTAIADVALAPSLAREVSAACEGPGRTSARHGFSVTLPAGHTGSVFVYAIDPAAIPGSPATADGLPPPPTLLRNGIVNLPAAVTSLPGTFGAVTTGWIEAPADGIYTFSAPLQPSRVSVNGQTLIDSWSGVGPTSGTITLRAGGRYHLRWNRLQSGPPASSADGLTWQPPGASGQETIPATLLYRIAPGAGQGLRATYYDADNLTGTSVEVVDPAVDIDEKATTLPGGLAASTFSVVWEGEIVPLYSDTYTFGITTAGTASLTVNGSELLPPVVPASNQSPSCPHDICGLGGKLTKGTSTTPACHPCVDIVCTADPYCCNGGYLSYYSTEPVWDAKCVAEADLYCRELAPPVRCTNPLPSPSTRQRDASPIALKAGVRYPIRLEVRNSTSDPTTDLQWASARQMRSSVPTFALFPRAPSVAPPPPANAGAGLNVAVFATENSGGSTEIDVDSPIATGPTTSLSLTPVVGPTGMPVVEVLAAPGDAVAGAPPPPVLASPKFGTQVFSASPFIPLVGFGGVPGGSVLVEVEASPPFGLVQIPIDANGNYQGTVTVPSYGDYTLLLTQRTYPSAPCALLPPAICAVSTVAKWSVTVAAEMPAPGTPPVITAPQDLTHSPAPAPATFVVSGTAKPGTIDVKDFGGSTATVSASLTNPVGPDGKVTGTITLSPAAGDPNAGWHKLVFYQPSAGGCATLDTCAGGSLPIFISVGVQPPTVEFPRTGAVLPCQPTSPGQVEIRGTLPYPVDSFGNLRIFQETGHAALEEVPSQFRVNPNPLPNGSFQFEGFAVVLAPGKHLLYFFQAPEPPATSTPQQRAAHFRAFASIAKTPTSRIRVDVPPRPMAFPPGFPPTQIVGSTQVGFSCNPGVPTGAFCALPNADVNVHANGRTWTTRATSAGSWGLTIDGLTPGLHDFTITQVVDSPAGGGWKESCPPRAVTVPVVSAGGAPTLNLPGVVTADAEDAAGAKVIYQVSATTADGGPAVVQCTPPSGSVFPVGETEVVCTALDPVTGAVGAGRFKVLVIDRPPVVNVPGDLTVEADNPLGAMVSYNVTATDVVDGPLPVDCAPSAPPGSPVLFPLDTDTTVVCTATDSSGQFTTASFVVRVRDTQGPVLCPLPDLRVKSNVPGGAIVAYATCAKDVVDGPVPVSCTRPSGSFFPIGVTPVTCTAKDKHGNAAKPDTFTVTVDDDRPPVLKLPRLVRVITKSPFGTRVEYVATATDDGPTPPKVLCDPPSGSFFRVGITRVNCVAIDGAGNRAFGSFPVQVISLSRLKVALHDRDHGHDRDHDKSREHDHDHNCDHDQDFDDEK